ncbi:hypothetical protein OH491_01970 [Termitidicoccus mucosus]|uniref:Transporter n=1 Tax=Termitidicoccus mucosus TaxID=1184151 RepID=A0A178IL62_9BACT|nr:hypothetical protein AW736_07585 [Opitutaceae bacterium TSB47]
MTSLHFLDYLIIGAYLVLMLVLGRVAGRHASKGEEGFFLAGRKLGKFYQLFLNFGNSTDANNAVSTVSLVYQQGVSAAWLAFQMVFMNPYFWFMNVWFRRVRLITMADLFEDRLGSRSLARLYAVFQILAAVVVTIGFGNLVTYKICTAIVVKPEAAWTVAERASVEGYHQWRELENRASSLTPAEAGELDVLRERVARGELSHSVSPINPFLFYLVYTLIVGGYIILGGMAATALNEIVQCFLIVSFSLMLLPVGLHAIGGFSALGERVPEAFFDLFGNLGSQVTTLTILAVFAVSWVQITGIMGNMSIGGSARDEYAARFGAVAGTYSKRLMVILWAFCGLVAVALYCGPAALSDPDMAWGMMSRQLLGPGLLGLMLTGVMAANMSSVAAQTMSISALFVRTIYLPLRPGATGARLVTVGRWAIACILGLGIFVAMAMNNIFTVFQLVLTVNVPFGAAVFMMLFWRRLTVPAVWCAVLISATVNLVAPLALARIDAVRHHPALTVRVENAAGGSNPVYFDTVVRQRPDDPASLLEGRERFHMELYLLNLAGVPVEKMSPGHRFAARMFFDALTPFVLLLGISLLTRAPEKRRVDLFYGKMKTPVDATPDLDAREMEETLRNPARFDHTKLFPNSSWEFTKWNRIDALGFLFCCAFSGALILLFWGLVRLVAP